MSTNSTPVMAWVASIMPGTAVGQSAFVTATVNITNGWEIQLPIAMQFSNVSSNDPEISVYASEDGGANYDTDSIAALGITRVATGKGQNSIRLSTGQYAIKILNPGPNTATAMVLTAAVITGILNQ